MLQKLIIGLLLCCLMHNSNLMTMKRLSTNIADIGLIRKKQKIDLHDKLDKKELTVQVLQGNIDVNELRNGKPLIVSVIDVIDELQQKTNQYIIEEKNDPNRWTIYKSNINTCIFISKEDAITRLNVEIEKLLNVLNIIVEHPSFDPSICINQDFYLPHFLVNRELTLAAQECPLPYKKERQDEIVAQILSHSKCPINSCNAEGKTALHLLACRFSFMPIAQKMVQQYAETEEPTDRLLELTELLLMRGAEVSIKDDKGNITLHYASYNNDPWMYLLLSMANLDHSPINKVGKLPWCCSELLCKHMLNKCDWQRINNLVDTKYRYSDLEDTDVLKRVNAVQQTIYLYLKEKIFTPLQRYFGITENNK